MRFHDERGQNIVEFAITLLILIFLTVGLIEIARFSYSISVVRAAAQAGARAGLVDETNVVPTVEEQMVGLDTSNTTIVITYPASNRIQVQVTYPFQFVLPLLPPFFGGDTIDITSTASISG
ncbi:MAG: pilus assembly protein [Chloroflexi bacterium]|nr:pilus assembly protein [Chloroflexota bacterium]